jgi:hypothetical protein
MLSRRVLKPFDEVSPYRFLIRGSESKQRKRRECEGITLIVFLEIASIAKPRAERVREA